MLYFIKLLLIFFMLLNLYSKFQIGFYYYFYIIFYILLTILCYTFKKINIPICHISVIILMGVIKRV